MTSTSLAVSPLRDIDASPISWRQAGKPTQGRAPVLFLHGLGGSRISWDEQLVAVGRWRHAVAWDLPGYGASPPLQGRAGAPVTFADLASAAARFIRSLDVPSAHVVGISFGGMIAQYLAAQHPTVVRSLTLLSSSPAFGLDGTQPAEWRAARLAPLDAGRSPADFAEVVLRSIAGPHITAEAFEAQCAAMRRVSAEGLRRSIDCLITHDSRALLPGITAPTLCMVGALDAETPPAYAQAIVDLVPGAHLMVVADAGHLLNAEAPAAVNRAILDHISSAEDSP